MSMLARVACSFHIYTKRARTPSLCNKRTQWRHQPHLCQTRVGPRHQEQLLRAVAHRLPSGESKNVAVRPMQCYDWALTAALRHLRALVSYFRLKTELMSIMVRHCVYFIACGNMMPQIVQLYQCDQRSSPTLRRVTFAPQLGPPAPTYDR